MNAAVGSAGAATAGAASDRGSASADERRWDVLVIGAGHNGLVAGCYLSRAGLDVLVVEADREIGGCTRTTNVIGAAPGHLINEGAVDFLWIRASTVVADLNLRSFGYRSVDLDPAFAYLHRDGSSLAIWQDPRRTAEEIRRFSPPDAAAYLEFARQQEALIEVMMPLMLSNPVRPPARVLLGALRTGATNVRRVGPMVRLLRDSAAEILHDRFQHPMVRDMVAGMAAIAAPITLPGSGLTLLFGAMVHRLGMGRPIGGSQALPNALARCLEHHGGRIRTSAEVEQLLVDDRGVHGVRLTGDEELTARAVIASCDPKQTLTRLLPPGVLSARQQARARGIPTENMGAAHLKVDVAFSGRLKLPRHQAWRRDDLDLRLPSCFTGTIDELSRAVDAAGSGTIPDPLPFWGIVPTGPDPSQAPDGQETLYLWAGWMPPQPELGQRAYKPAAAEALIKAASEYYDGIERLELGRLVRTPVELAADLRLTDGQPWHVDFNRRALGPLRPALGFGGYRTPVDGLFLTGAGTHPSPGVSGIPGQLAAGAVLRSLSRTRP
jgi:phytoene dehydrogenase-like protein